MAGLEASERDLIKHRIRAKSSLAILLDSGEIHSRSTVSLSVCYSVDTNNSFNATMSLSSNYSLN